MDVTLRCRAYPGEGTASEAWRHIEIHRQIRNHAIRDYYSHDYGNRPTAYDQHRKLTDWKQQWLLFSEVSAHAAQQTVSEIHKNVETQKSRRESGYKTGRLKWQGSGERRSVAYQSEGFDVNHTTGQDGYATLRLSKIGHIPIRAHRELPATENIKRVVLKKERTGDWFVYLVTERPDEELPEKPQPDTLDPTDCVGVDLGILSYIHTSDDTAVDMLDLSDEYDCYGREQRKLDRKEHGSNNWEKQRQNVARAKRQIKRKVLDYQHKLTTWLVREYDLVAVEDLDVKPMLETSQNAKNKQDAAWSRFLDLLEYKADLHGTHVVRVEPAGTTKECSECGVETSKPLWIREHSCPACGHTEDRDLNAAKNILSRGRKQIGAGRSESTPVQTALPTFTPLRVDAKRVVEAGSPEA
ncbi:RNA-guided endonuclease InsQ/TnpB family protein [Halorubrum amylolyticum]|uniref:RNA-guided endonuclease InsQ/TnpB family protein n=1 Tax=Halorubrum amylolyticum TaxID=2508724 RepID=UPI0010087F72|nr:RNA-guided endonuclease TnpB family protein [Halorubrum amylolyticum]